MFSYIKFQPYIDSELVNQHVDHIHQNLIACKDIVENELRLNGQVSLTRIKERCYDYKDVSFSRLNKNHFDLVHKRLSKITGLYVDGGSDGLYFQVIHFK